MVTLFFLHIPKTGGSSLNTLLARLYGDSVYRTPNRMMEDESLLRSFRRDARGLACIRGHFQYGLHEQLGVTDPTYITFVRDPVDRLLSLYHYLAHGRPAGHKYRDEVRAMTFAEFVRSTRRDWRFLDNDMTRRLGGGAGGPVTKETYRRAIANLSYFPFVGLTEQYHQALERWAQLFGWETTEYESVYRQPNRLQQRSLPGSLVAEIHERQHFDMALYGYIAERDWPEWII